MEKIFTDFLSSHHLLHLAVLEQEIPWSATLFYAFDPSSCELIVATDPKTRHGQSALRNPKVAGSIALETEEIGRIQGVQFSGRWQKANQEAKKLYFKRFPYARILHPQLWSIEITYAKLTDNRLGFGTKLEFHSTISKG